MEKRIQTNLFGQTNYDILSSVIGQLSDGIWENSRQCERYWKSLDIIKDENDEIIIISNNSWLFNTNDECKKYFATKMKQIVKKELEWENKNIEWNRNCQEYLIYFHGNTKVSDVYKAYDKLLNRKER